jgi:peptide deformylase
VRPLKYGAVTRDLTEKDFAVAILPIIQYPDPVLAAKAEPVTEFNDELKKLAADMAETMYAAPGVGLAAPQVGVLKRLVVIDVSDDKSDLRVLVNPKITSHTDTLEECEEGCLSLKGLYEKVKRPDGVTVAAQDTDGNPIEFAATGLLAVCCQHEIDHLDGIVFIDHLSRLKKTRAITKLHKIRRNARKEAKEKAERAA